MTTQGQTWIRQRIRLLSLYLIENDIRLAEVVLGENCTFSTSQDPEKPLTHCKQLRRL